MNVDSKGWLSPARILRNFYRKGYYFAKKDGVCLKLPEREAYLLYLLSSRGADLEDNLGVLNLLYKAGYNLFDRSGVEVLLPDAVYLCEAEAIYSLPDTHPAVMTIEEAVNNVYKNGLSFYTNFGGRYEVYGSFQQEYFLHLLGKVIDIKTEKSFYDIMDEIEVGGFSALSLSAIERLKAEGIIKKIIEVGVIEEGDGEEYLEL